jgi:hypothetical protein
VDLNEMATALPDVRGSINNIKERRLEVLISSKPAVAERFYYNTETNRSLSKTRPSSTSSSTSIGISSATPSRTLSRYSTVPATGKASAHHLPLASAPSGRAALATTPCAQRSATASKAVREGSRDAPYVGPLETAGGEGLRARNRFKALRAGQGGGMAGVRETNRNRGTTSASMYSPRGAFCPSVKRVPEAPPDLPLDRERSGGVLVFADELA